MTNTAPEVRGLTIRQSSGRAAVPRGAPRFARLSHLRRIALAVLLVCASSAAAPATPAGASELKPWIEGARSAFTLDDLTGRPRDLREFAGKVVLVHFFATWCEPCREEITSLHKLKQESANKPLAIVAVDVAEVDLRVRAFFEKLPVDFPVLLDRDRAVAKSWGVIALPSTFVLDAALAPKLFVEGDLEWTRPDIVKRIKALYPAGTPIGPRAGG